MGYICFGRYLPASLRNALFGDRQRHGLVAKPADTDWQRWREIDLDFYDQNQRESIGSVVNRAGHRVMQRVSLAGLTVLEIGPGSLDHIVNWRDKPDNFYAVDINRGFLDRATARLTSAGVCHKAIVTDVADKGVLPLPDASVDMVLSFYSLEHLYPLDDYLAEIERVLKPGGRLVGAIPCEGGIGWGLGRYVTTRRWLLANGISDPGKIISWEHPNFADTVLAAVEQRFVRRHIGFWPLVVPIVDVNLIASFIVEKPVV